MVTLGRFWSAIARRPRRLPVVRWVGERGVDGLDAWPEELLREEGWPDDVVGQWLAGDPVVTGGVPLRVGDPGYPGALLDLPSPPAVIFVRGEPGILGQPGSVAIVGTRNCTGDGAIVARRLGQKVGRRSEVMVSGLARGIDGHAHRGAVEEGLSVAVLGHGLDYVSPASNRALSQRIVQQGGALVSIWPDDSPPLAWRFPQRNPVIAALADDVVVVEAPEGSGALGTAMAGSKMGRRVWVYGGKGDSVDAGGLGLVREGFAIGFQSVEELLGGPEWPESWQEELGQGTSVDRICGRWEIGVEVVLAHAGKLEAKGLLVKLPGGRYLTQGRRDVGRAAG